MQEIGGKAAIERLAKIGGQRAGYSPAGGTTVLVGMTPYERIEALAIGRHHVLDVAHILQPAFYLERGGTCSNQFFQMVRQVQVLQRQQVTLVLQLTAVGIDEVELHAAELGTLATVGRATETVLGNIAQATVADTQGSVDKDLQLDVGNLLVNLGYLPGRQFTSQHDTAKTAVAQPAHLLGRAVVRLCRGMENYGGQRQPEYAHVLNQYGVDPGSIQLMDKLLGVGEFVVVDNGVDRDVDFYAKRVGILA